MVVEKLSCFGGVSGRWGTHFGLSDLRVGLLWWGCRTQGLQELFSCLLGYLAFKW